MLRWMFRRATSRALISNQYERDQGDNRRNENQHRENLQHRRSFRSLPPEEIGRRAPVCMRPRSQTSES
jgi:hypothetical protein